MENKNWFAVSKQQARQKKIESKKIIFTSHDNLINLSFDDNAILTGNIKSDGYELKSRSSYSKNVILNSKFDELLKELKIEKICPTD